MNIVLKLYQFNQNYLYFCEPIKNNIMNDGNFIRILYSTHNVVLNGLYLFISLNNVECEKYYNKFKYIFNIHNNENKKIIEKIKLIEENILKNINIPNKYPQFKINEQFKNGYIKLFNNSQNIQDDKQINFILKISGVWETTLNYGLTFKFVPINQYNP